MLFSSPAEAERRVALVIGNGAYSKVPKLTNPPNDAAAIEALLRAAGFDPVVRVADLGAAQMRRALRDFADEVRDADIAVVFYSGHGMEINGVNYLIPVDAVLQRDIDVADETIPLDRINLILEPAKRLRLVILDACRDNPFAHSMRRTLAGRAIGRGLAPVEVTTTDTLFAYAAKAGSTAADGEGANSPYTSALIKHLTTPGLDLRLALGRVRDDVIRTTGRRQEPFVYGSLGGAELPLVEGQRSNLRQPMSPTAPASSTSPAAEAWDRIKETSDAAVLEAFIARFGATFYGDLARVRLSAERQRAEGLGRQRQQETAEAKRQGDAEARARAAAEADTQRRADENERKRLALEQTRSVPSRWNHNGSLMKLIADGARRQFVYDAPRDGMLAQGVAPGTLLFEGTRSGSAYNGTAYIFSKNCGARPYAVSGTVAADDRSISMVGRAPRINSACQVFGYIDDTITFELVEPR